MMCQFETHGNAIRCKVCKRYLPLTDTSVRRNCTTSKLTTYAKALAKWNSSGRPTRDDDEVSRIFTICESCEHFDPRRKKCKLCGCRLNISKVAPLNKIRMATEECPAGKWK